MTDEQKGVYIKVGPSDLTWAEGIVGTKFLAYLLGCSTDAIPPLASGAVPLSNEQLSVLTELVGLREHIAQNFSEAPVEDIVSFVLTQLNESGKVPARDLRERVTGTEQVPTGQDDLERALIAFAFDAYPAFLLLPESEFSIPMQEDISIRVTQLLFRHPQVKEFSEAVLRDPVLKDIFTQENEHTGRTAFFYRNTGSGGGLQLLMLPDMILRNAWSHVGGDDISPEAFVDEVVEGLRLVRDVLAGKSRHATARIAFAGVLLPPGARFEVNNGVVHEVTERDRQFVPESLKGQLQGTDSSGATTLINYDGDVILEYKFPYRVKIAREKLGEIPDPWPADMLPPPEIQQSAIRLRFSLMLAVEREQRAQLVQTWQSFDEPINHGRGLSWYDPRRGTSIMPIQLTDTEVAAWREWYDRLNSAPVAKIEVALTRILRAIAERLEPSDVLIDSVIAWENLFGTKEGEPTFRVTSCLAKLLEKSTEKRLELKTRLGKIYALRSKVVHGSGTLKADEYPLCQEALDVAVRAVKVLTVERLDILKLSDGAHRSANLLLGD